MKRLAILTVVANLAMAGAAGAAEVEVRLLNKGTDGGTMVFEPAFVKIAPGDIVTFRPTGNEHSVETIKGMLPDGAKPVVGTNGEDVAVTFEREGVYGVKCLPHYGICMVVMVGVGASANVDKAKAVPQAGKAKQASSKMASK
jgi:pseudoazurin